MDGVNRYAFFAYIDEGDNAEFDYHIESDGSWVKASDYEQLKAENERLASNLRGKHAVAGATYTHLIAERDQLVADLDDANSRVNVLKEQWRMIEAERDTLRKQLDEARELLEECGDMADACEDQVLLGHIDAWLEPTK